jgi:hypothetical protein
VVADGETLSSLLTQGAGVPFRRRGAPPLLVATRLLASTAISRARARWQCCDLTSQQVEIMLVLFYFQGGTMGALKLVARREIDASLPETPSTTDPALTLLASLAADQRGLQPGQG